MQTMRIHANSANRIHEKGQLLLEILIAITIAGVILGLGSQSIVLSLRGNKGANEKNIALGLLEETMEAVRNASGEKWQNLFNLTHGSTQYHPIQSAGKWDISSAGATGSESVVLNSITYTRYFNVRHLCRDNSTRNITGVTDTDGSATTCVSSGGTFDPSTQKVTGNVSWPNASALTAEEYLAGRWRNKACNNTGWATGGNSSVNTCPSTNYDTKTNINTSVNTELKLCNGC